MRRIIGVLLGLGVIVGLRFGLPTLWIKAEAVSGHGWDDARSELSIQLTPKLSAAIESAFDVTPAVQQAVIACVVDATIDFLNETDCRYKYIEGTTTREDHLREQDACVTASGLEAKQPDIEVRCMQEHFPDDWAILRPSLLASQLKALKGEQSLDEARRQAISSCYVDKLIPAAKAAGCAFIDRETDDMDRVLVGLAPCFDAQPDFEKATNRLFEACVAAQ